VALDPALATQYGPNQLNMWAMLRALVFNNVGILPFQGVPTSGTTGTYATFAGPGSILIDTNTGNLYTNLNTAASPLWTPLNIPIVANGGLGSVGNAKMTYDFAVDGGAIATITPTNSPTIPANAIILGGAIDITTSLGSGGAATIALGLGSGAQVASLKAATGVASYTAGFLAMIPVFTAATYYKVTAAARLTLTVAAVVLNAGKLDVNIVYIMGNA
jgi:hypothetical protein